MALLDRHAVKAANPIEQLIPALVGEHPIEVGGELKVRCPWHEDKRPSLRINPAKQVWHCDPCQQGGDCFTFVEKFQQVAFPDALTFLANRAGISPATAPPRRREIATYDYRDSAGHLLYQTVRYEPKDFRQRRPNGNGGWIWNLEGVSRVVYRLPELQGKVALVICEGEKDVDRCWAAGLAATCNVGGAGKWVGECTAQLQAAGVQRVRIVPDNDEPGRSHADDVARSCLAAGIDARVVVLSDLPSKGDLSDFLDRHSKDDLVAELKTAPEYTPSPTSVQAMLQPPATPPAKREKREKAKQGRTVEIPDPEPWPEAVDGAAMLDAVVTVLRAFVVFETPAYADALALWILHTYLMPIWYISPLAVANSPTMRCGKTTLVQVVTHLVRRPLTATNISAAALFRMIEVAKPTLILDEAETYLKENEELRGIVNGGHTRATASVIRTVGESHEPAYFSTWSAKFLALIGRLPATLMDRAIVIPMRRKGPGERVESLRLDRIAVRTLPLCRQMVRWADDHAAALATADPDMPALADDRAADNWRPLLALADAAGPVWSARARQVAADISGRREDDDASPLALLRDTRTVFDELESTVTEATSAQLVERLNKLQDRPWADVRQGKGLTPAWFAARMKDFGVYPGGPYWFTVDGTSKQLRGYRRASFADAFDRYLGDQTVTLSQPQQRRADVRVQVCNKEIRTLHPESVTTPIATGLNDDVTVSSPREAIGDDVGSADAAVRFEL